MTSRSEHFCPEGLNRSNIGDVTLSMLDSRILCMILEQVIEGNDISGFNEEATVILEGISRQLRPLEYLEIDE